MDKNASKRAKELDINISAAAERGIIEYIKEMENIRRDNASFSNYDTTNDNKQKHLHQKVSKDAKDQVGLLKFA